MSVLIQLVAERTGFHPVSRERLPAATERRLGARRVSANGLAAQLQAREAHRRGVVRAPAQEARQLARALRDRCETERHCRTCARRSCRPPTSCSSRSSWREAGAAAAKINLALVVGPRRDDGRHELVTVYQRVALADHLTVERAPEVRVAGFKGDTLVRRALESLADGNGGFPRAIKKRIPVAAGLGGGSSDAATALRLANALRDDPARRSAAARCSRASSAPTFRTSSRTGRSSGRATAPSSQPLELPQDYWIVLVVPTGSRKRVDGRRLRGLRRARRRGGIRRTRGSAACRARNAFAGRATSRRLPPNDLASSPLADELLALGAFRADVTGAGPAVYGLFLHGEQARRAQRQISPRGRTWLTAPAWYR